MKNIQIIGLILVIAGSFLPLVHIPIIGNWNYFDVDHNLAIFCWVFSAFALLGIFGNKKKLVQFSAVLLILLFIFTIVAIKFKSMDYFSFLPFKNWQEVAAGSVKLSWGWLFEFLGAVIMLLAKDNKSL